ncbi:MAG: GTPase [Fervidobacterium sp.]
MMLEKNGKPANKTNINTWYPGHIQKAKKQIKDNIKKIDVVLIVLDARAPATTTSFEIKLFKDKNKLFILNKSDLADENYNQYWVQEISKRFPVLLANKDISRRDLLNFIKKNSDKENPHIAVVGVPNVGKSTIINKILGKHKTKTGAQPGITKGVQWVNIDNLTVLDSPGILYSEIFSKEIAAKMLLIGSIPLENVSDDIYDEAFQIFKTTSDKNLNFYEFIEEIGKRRGLLKKGGTVDFEKAKFFFFKELSEGKLGRYTYDRELSKFWEVLKNG